MVEKELTLLDFQMIRVEVQFVFFSMVGLFNADIRRLRIIDSRGTLVFSLSGEDSSFSLTDFNISGTLIFDDVISITNIRQVKVANTHAHRVTLHGRFLFVSSLKLKMYVVTRVLITDSTMLKDLFLINRVYLMINSLEIYRSKLSRKALYIVKAVTTATSLTLVDVD